ncbi:MAG: hypothetical protein H0W96_04825, partial [Solirubrobacterales bacterium]|nr:hypothetical protein [Solirubrobacterales bacterium]
TTQTAPRTTTIGSPPPPPPPPPPPAVAAEPEPEVETAPEPVPGANECSDGIDNDRDDLVDASQDDGCLDNDTEAPANLPDQEEDGQQSPEESECNDKFDNDSDGFEDDEDPSCPGDTESPPDDDR